MKTIYTINAAYRGKPLELLCTAFPGQAILPKFSRPKSVKVAEIQYEPGEDCEDVLSLTFQDGSNFTMVGTTLISRFIDDCIGPRYATPPEEHVQNGVVTLAGNRFWAYTGEDGVKAIVSAPVKAKFEAKEVALDELVG